MIQLLNSDSKRLNRTILNIKYRHSQDFYSQFIANESLLNMFNLFIFSRIQFLGVKNV